MDYGYRGAYIHGAVSIVIRQDDYGFGMGFVVLDDLCKDENLTAINYGKDYSVNSYTFEDMVDRIYRIGRGKIRDFNSFYVDKCLKLVSIFNTLDLRPIYSLSPYIRNPVTDDPKKVTVESITIAFPEYVLNALKKQNLVSDKCKQTIHKVKSDKIVYKHCMDKVSTLLRKRFTMPEREDSKYELQVEIDDREWTGKV